MDGWHRGLSLGMVGTKYSARRFIAVATSAGSIVREPTTAFSCGPASGLGVDDNCDVIEANRKDLTVVAAG